MGATRVGKTLGNFRILECLGSGGAGMIWKAEDLSLGRVVAIKALRPELAHDGEMAERFRAEARTLAKLSHVNVAALYSLIEDDDALFLVMEYVEGNTLAALLATSGPLPFDSAFALFHQVLDGVGHAHEAGVVHRDLKPANLMVDARGRVKVMDFGIARIAGAARTTHHGKLVGTPEYMSPEQVRGEDATLRSDLYSLGIVLYEMLTGQPPFRAAASFELMRAQLESEPPDPRLHRRGLDARVAEAVLRALAKRPADRFSSTRELQDVLLGAGASRRGRTILPVWRDVPTPGASSEAQTLVSASAETVSESSAVPQHASTTEPYPAVHAQAPSALDVAVDDVFARASSEDKSRADASATRVIDASLETIQIEPAHPTRMLEDAPFDAQVRALARDGETGAAGMPRAQLLLWAAGAALAVLLALGVVKLASREERPEPAAAVVPEAPAAAAASQRADQASKPEPRVDLAPVETAKPKPMTAVREPEPAPAPLSEPDPAPSEEESGWTIRR